MRIVYHLFLFAFGNSDVRTLNLQVDIVLKLNTMVENKDFLLY